MRAGALAAALAALVYVNALDNPFVYDDHDTVVANPSIVDPSNVRFVLVHSPFRPVVNVSYAVDRAIWGLNPFGFHLTNVLLHAGVVWLLYVFIRTALADADVRTGSVDDARVRRVGAGFDRRSRAAFAGAALFGVHPLMTEAVGYVSGRSELLCGFFFLAALLCARRAAVGEGRRGFAVTGAAAFAMLALLSKEVALALPVVMFCYDWIVLPSAADVRRRRIMRVYGPILAAIAAAAAYRFTLLSGPVSTDAPHLNLLTQSIVIWRYLGLLVVPAGQSIMHGVYRVQTIGDPLGLGAAAGLVGLAALAIVARTRQPVAAFGILWFLLCIAPSSSVLALREGMAEHRVYLASAGIFMALSAAAGAVLAFARGRAPFAIATTVAIAALGAATVVRNQVWSSPVALWREATVHAAGMWEPHYALADSLRDAGDCRAAIPEYQAVVRLQPQHRDAHTNLGICLAQTGRLEEAERAFRRALALDPQFARGYTNLGALALVAGDSEQARDFYLHAIRLEPRNVLARMQLARLYELTFQDYHSAARMCGEARAIAPATPGVVECVERNQKLAAAKDSGR